MCPRGRPRGQGRPRGLHLWSVVKPNTTSTPPVELQNPSNSSDVACRSEVKRGKNYEKKRKRKEASNEGSGWYDTC